MKKSIIKLIIYTIPGIIVSVVLYNIELHNNYMLNRHIINHVHYGIYIAPFIGIVYWLFTRGLDD